MVKRIDSSSLRYTVFYKNNLCKITEKKKILKDYFGTNNQITVFTTLKTKKIRRIKMISYPADFSVYTTHEIQLGNSLLSVGQLVAISWPTRHHELGISFFIQKKIKTYGLPVRYLPPKHQFQP